MRETTSVRMSECTCWAKKRNWGPVTRRVGDNESDRLMRAVDAAAWSGLMKGQGPKAYGDVLRSTDYILSM